LGDVLDVALVDPDLHADTAEGRLGLEEAVVHVRAERVQGHAALAVELRAGHLGAAEAAAALDLDALGARLHRRLHALAHGAADWAASGACCWGFVSWGLFRWTCAPVSFRRAPRMRSASAPRRPMTMPGRAVWMSTRTRSRVRSISTLEMPARSMPDVIIRRM